MTILTTNDRLNRLEKMVAAHRKVAELHQKTVENLVGVVGELTAIIEKGQKADVATTHFPKMQHWQCPHCTAGQFVPVGERWLAPVIMTVICIDCEASTRLQVSDSTLPVSLKDE
jgi:hypothetical protein